MHEPVRNDYLNQVQEQQQRVEVDLKARKVASPLSMPTQAAAPRRRGLALGPTERTSNAVDVRITGFWRWKTVVVPPNAYVVHTRRGHFRPGQGLLPRRTRGHADHPHQ